MQRFQRIGFILIAFGVALLVGTLYRVCELWSGGLPIWPILLIASSIGLLSGWLSQRRTTFRIDQIIAVGYTLLTLILFWDLQSILDDWGAFFQQSSITYSQWLQTIITQSTLWLAPPILWMTFAWIRDKQQPKGRLSIFITACIGIIFTHFLVGRVASAILLLTALLLMVEGTILLCLSTLNNENIRKKSMVILPLLGLVLIIFSPTIYRNITKDRFNREQMPDLLHFYPFAPIAACNFKTPLTPPSPTYIQKQGAYLRTNEKEAQATLEVSQQLATILKPNRGARRGFRPLINAKEDIKGQYDVLWVEVPPAWQSEERDYFDKGVVKSLLNTVNENGYLIYHIDIRPLTLEALLTRAEALAVHFPHIQLWVTSSTHWQLVAARKALPIQPMPPDVEACRITTNLCALKRSEDKLGFRLFETWYARKELFNVNHVEALDKPLINRIK